MTVMESTHLPGKVLDEVSRFGDQGLQSAGESNHAPPCPMDLFPGAARTCRVPSFVIRESVSLPIVFGKDPNGSAEVVEVRLELIGKRHDVE
jgi:hypothetical protein